jgi:hypothetical protein
MWRLGFAAAALCSAVPRCRVTLAQLEPTSVRTVASIAELDQVIRACPLDGITLLMLSVRGDPKAAKVKEHLVNRCALPTLRRHHWECSPDDEASLKDMRSLGATQTPYFVAYDCQGDRVLSFVAQTAGALLYGLEDTMSVIAAREEERRATAAPDSSNSDVSQLAARVSSLEAELDEVRMQASVQRAELSALMTALTRFEGLAERICTLEAAVQPQLAVQPVSEASSDALSSFLSAVPDEQEDIADPFLFVLGKR